jgi:hypothetical protein
MVGPQGHLSVVLQLPSLEEQEVSSTTFASIQKLSEHFTLIDSKQLQHLLGQQGFQLVDHGYRALPGGKSLWLGIFAKAKRSEDSSN